MKTKNPPSYLDKLHHYVSDAQLSSPSGVVALTTSPLRSSLSVPEIMLNISESDR